MSELEKRFPIYSKLLKLYPKSYRKQYEQQLLQTTADMLDDAPSNAAKLAGWTHIAIDLPLSVTKQQLQYVGGIYMNETPRYIKRNSIIAGALLLPFIAALIANGLDKVINNHTLYNSWLWRTPILSLWVLRLPEIALLLAVGSYIVYLARGTGSTKSTWLKRALDIKHSWPIIIPAIFAFGIMFLLAFHDVGQCIQSPSHAVSNINQTWHCAVNNRSLPVFRKLI